MFLMSNIEGWIMDVLYMIICDILSNFCLSHQSQPCMCVGSVEIKFSVFLLKDVGRKKLSK